MLRPVDPQCAVSVSRMQTLDTQAIEQTGIPRLLLMEHAGQALTAAVLQLLSSPGRVLVCCGTGYNGGDGLCAAWHLAHRGYAVEVWLAGAPSSLRQEPAVYAAILRALKVPIRCVEPPKTAPDFSQAEVVIDALLGIGVRGSVRPPASAWIQAMNRSGAPIISADVPSGLDADSGQPQGCAVRASVTVTFAAVKHGLFRGQGPAHAGRVLLDDLEIPSV